MMQSEADTQQRFRREFLWRFSKYVLDESDFIWAERHTAELRRFAVEPTFPVLRYVWNHLSANVIQLEERMPDLAPIAAAIGQHCEIHRATWHKTIGAQDELFAAFAQARLWPLAIKGAAARAVTSAPQAMTDLDVLARDLDQAWQVIEIAEQLGYPLRKIKLRHLPDNVPGEVRYHGYANLYRCEGSADFTQAHWDMGHVRTLDLHIGRFYGPGEGVLITDLWQRATRRTVGGEPVLTPSIEDMVVIEMLHLVRHGTLSMGTLNRVCQLLTEHDLDLAYLNGQIKANSLVAMAHATLRAISDTFPHATTAARHLGSHLPSPPPSLRWAVEAVSRMRRVERYGAGSPASVALQAAYVYTTTRDQIGRVLPVDSGVVGFARMFRNRRIYPRAHRRWDDRRIGWPSPKRTAVMMTRLDCVRWRPPHPQLETPTPSRRWVGATTLLIDEDQPTHTMLTPIGAFTSSRYDGAITPDEKNACLQRAHQVRTDVHVPSDPTGPHDTRPAEENHCGTTKEGQ
ncbi:nucleotidyltransferase family protein [Nocardia sp. NPDC088792]|uniref:nucleotidyltransferase family protein n=1 Tax=Nocardia sp. NPDC088792 TaxID=3364332 RepID=UPI0037FE0728